VGKLSNNEKKLVKYTFKYFGQFKNNLSNFILLFERIKNSFMSILLLVK